ncbi:MAG: hypothetical protein MSL26_03965 [Clostridiales bacterium]|nr:hypothetical protein [Clostridiales bacterium]
MLTVLAVVLLLLAFAKLMTMTDRRVASASDVNSYLRCEYNVYSLRRPTASALRNLRLKKAIKKKAVLRHCLLFCRAGCPRGYLPLSSSLHRQPTASLCVMT